VQRLPHKWAFVAWMESDWLAVSEVVPKSTHNAYLDDSVQSVLMALSINSTILVAQLVLFWVLLHFKRLRQVLAPRLAIDPGGAPCSVMAWAVRAWQRGKELEPCDTDYRSEVRNLDGAIMVRFCFLGFKFSAFGSVVGVGLIPLYAWGDGGARGFNKYNLSNLSRGHYHGDYFWVVVLAAYLLTAAFLHFVAGEWRRYIKMRESQFKRFASGKAGPGKAQALRSLLIEGVPRGEDRCGIQRFFGELFPAHGRPSSVHSCVLQPDTGELYRLPVAILRRAKQSAVLKLRQALPFELLLPESPASLHFGKDRHHVLQDMNEELEHDISIATRFIHDVAIGHEGSSTAFVTLNSVADRVIAEQLVLDHKKNSWRASAAPEPCDIVWANAAVPLHQVDARTSLTRMWLLVGLIFWSMPVTAIQAWTNMENLPDVEWVQDFRKSQDLLFTFLSSYVPVLALMSLMYLLPFLLEWFARVYEGHKVKSEIQRLVMGRYLNYMLATLYVTVMSGSLAKALAQILKSPQLAFQILRTQVPQVACYFVTYVIARVGISVPMLLLFPALSLLDCSATPGKVPPVYPNFAMEASNLGLVLVLGLTYSVIAPAILPLCAAYFALAWLVYRWLFLYVYTPEFNCRGAFWNELFHGSMVGLLLGTLSLAALADLWSSEFFALLVLSGVVVVFHYLFHEHFAVPSRFPSLKEARRVDEKCGDAVLASFDPSFYVDPIIKESLAQDPEEQSDTTGSGESEEGQSGEDDGELP